MEFIKLTRFDEEKERRNVVFINANSIAQFCRFGYEYDCKPYTGTNIWLNNGKTITVCESPEEILELIKSAEKPYPQSISVQIPERYGR